MSESNTKRTGSKKPKYPKGGRPIQLTEELQTTIIENIKIGAYVETAAASAGISKNTFYDWLKRGARARQAGDWPEEEDQFVRFSDAIKKAIADAEIRDVALIARAAQVNWTAAAWRLERKFPNRWGRKEQTKVEHSGSLGVANIPPAEQQEYASRLANFFGENVDFEFEEEPEETDLGE